MHIGSILHGISFFDVTRQADSVVMRPFCLCEGAYRALVDLAGVESAYVRVESLGRRVWVRVLGHDFALVLDMPSDVDQAQVTATLKNGRLTISAPQLQPHPVEVVVG